MKEQNEHHSFTGMQRDMEISKHPANFLYDARNIRITQRDGTTLFAITNERGTVDLDKSITGKYLGHCLLNNWLVVFSKDMTYDAETASQQSGPDYITRFDLSAQDNNEYPKVVLYAGDLTFSVDHLIEAIGSYENESVQKVYWTDGYNQPRIINVTPEYDPSETYDESNPVYDSAHNTAFDFVRELQLNETVKVRKVLGAGGMFPAGVIQYAFTYYDKHGQESNIFYTSPLLYTSHKDRGGSPEDKVDNGFEVTIENPDTNFDYVRIYSIMRTSVNGTPIARRVEDIYLHSENEVDSVSYLDIGTSGEVIDPTELLYKGGEEITAQTIEQKDGTLFLGNINITRPSLDEYRQEIHGKVSFQGERREMYLQSALEGSYQYSSQLTAFADEEQTQSVSCAGFKRGDYYRLGVQFQYKNGKWSEPLHVSDSIQSSFPYIGGTSVDNKRMLIPVFKGSMDREFSDELYNKGYRKVRAVVVLPSLQDRVTICQCVSAPTVFQPSRRYQDPSDVSADNNDGDLYAQSSWFLRPTIKSGVDQINGVQVAPDDNGVLGYTRNAIINDQTEHVDLYDPSDIRAVEIQGVFDYYNRFHVDTFFRTFHSPDIEFDDSLWLYDFEGTKSRFVGKSVFSNTYSDIDIQTESATASSLGSGFVHKTCNGFGAYGWVSGLFWDDFIIEDRMKDNKAVLETEDAEISPCKWVVYPWNRTGSLNNDITRPEGLGVRSAMLKKKVLSNLRFSHTVFKTVDVRDDHQQETQLNEKDYIDFGTVDNYTEFPKLHSSDQLSILKFGNRIYQANIDTLLMPDDTEGMYFSFNGSNISTNEGGVDAKTPFDCNKWWKTSSRLIKSQQVGPGITIRKKVAGYALFNGNSWTIKNSDLGNQYPEIGENKEPVRMKYKSTPHCVAGYVYDAQHPIESSVSYGAFTLPIIEIVRPGDHDNDGTLYPPLYRETMFGGLSEDALQANNWIPCGEPVTLPVPEETASNLLNAGSHDTVIDDDPETAGGGYEQHQDYSNVDLSGDYVISVWKDFNGDVVSGYKIYNPQDTSGESGGSSELSGDDQGSGLNTGDEDASTSIEFFASYGDTYYQRWDCLKTYPFTREDINQIVEIGSFMLETHVNIDGRYDRNRGQMNNLNMGPTNFNLLNPVYSQTDNFFTYKILDESFYKNNSFPNQVTWTKEKQAGADIDLWTNITLASTYDMDGSKGEVVSLNTWKDSIFCFQNKGISNILFNSRVQIPTSDGVPIEISNSYKVDGYRYITDGTGCVNKWSIRETPAGIYFIDSVTNDLYHVGEGLTDVSLTHNMQTWFKDNTIDKTLYDDVHHDIYLVNNTEALCYSEILGQFTSFMDYGGMYLLESCSKEVFSMYRGLQTQSTTVLFKMFKGSYNDLFGAYDNMHRYQVNLRPWYISFVSNGLENKDMDSDKIFTNIDYRMDLFSDNDVYLPEESFNTIRVWNEYQDTGDVTLRHPVVIGTPVSYNLDEMNLEKKYRIWRIQIPRDSTNILDRIRNPWCKITLERYALDSNKAILQDLNVQYFV